MSFACLSIILIAIIWEVFIQNILNNHNRNSNKSIIIKKYISNSIEIIPDKNIYTRMVYLDLLKKYLSINKSIKKINTYHYVVSEGDLINKILIKYSDGLDSSDIHFLLKQYPILKNLNSGQVFFWITTMQKKLQCLVWGVSPQEIRVYHRMHVGFIENIIRISNQSYDKSFYTILFIGELRDTFINSARSLGIEENCIIDIINALKYQLDFRKLHQGDRFAVLISKTINDDDTIHSKLLGARLYTAGKNYYVFGANNGRFYDREAVRLGSNFIRFPIVEPFRISSNFDLNRLNPVTGKVSPHAGVDFAIPIGTPILSVGDGEVMVSAYSKIAGNYIVIRHNYHCITRYMHLKKILVKPGQKVKRGDNIALSGNTGRSTGPHLHFEIWVNQRPVNPLTNTMLNVEQLLGNERVIYLNQISKILPQLLFN